MPELVQRRDRHQCVEQQQHREHHAPRHRPRHAPAHPGRHQLQSVCSLAPNSGAATHFFPRIVSVHGHTVGSQRGASLDYVASVHGPTALITGASRGIGRGIALALASRGWNLILNYARNEAAARGTVQDCLARAEAAGHGIHAHPVAADLSSREDRARLVERARELAPRCDLLVNNAGIAPTVRADLLDASEESFDQLIATNLKGPYFLTQQVARWMIEGAAASHASMLPPHPPCMVFISSISAYTASVNRGDYCLSKAGVAMMTSLFAARLAPHGIGVFEVRPGIIATDMTGPVKEKYDRLIADGLTPIRRWGTPEDVGSAVAAIAGGAFPFSTGEVINVDGGFHLRRL